MRFHATVEQSGKTATGIVIPAEIVTALGSGKRPAVRVTINGYTYRSSVATVSGAFMVGVSADVREKAGVSGGGDVDVDVELDTEPREVDVPPDFVEALSQDPDAKRFFDSLTYSNKRRFVYSIKDAKTAETRQRRIDKAVAILHDQRI
jgi:hypothetical protein